jgi:glucose-1-phosphate thymidylyltransferase
MVKTKGIILAGGRATRLEPMTKVVSKQLLPIYDKPMIYYPLSTLMLAGIKEVLIISTPKDLPRFNELLEDGSQWGMNFKYIQQDKPRGLPDAFNIGRDFIGNDNSLLILGDNIFYGQGISKILQDTTKKNEGSTIFGYPVSDPQRYGVVELTPQGKIISLEEKPKEPKSNIAIVGLYYFDNRVIDLASKCTPSARGELEITDLMRPYLKEGKLEIEVLRRGFAWFDAGTPDSLSEAGEYIRVVQKRQGYKISCPEEIAHHRGFIDDSQLRKLAERAGSPDYKSYLFNCLNPDSIPLPKF